MRDTTLLIQTDNGYQELDIYENIPISITYSELEVGNLDTRNSPYSLIFTIPGTDNNNWIFQGFYEVNGINFNPLIDRKCVVQYKGIDIFRGYLRLNAVITTWDLIEYEIYITSQVSDLSSAMGDITLRNLPWAQYQHDLNYTSVTTSWSANTFNDNGLFEGDILYPMINYGLEYPSGTTANVPTFTFSMDNDVQNGSMTFSGNSISPLYFKPAIRLKAIVDNIFDYLGYNYTSEFFDTDYFRSIYMDTAQNGKLGPEFPSGITSQNFFRVYTPPNVSYLLPDGVLQPFPITNFGTNGYDPLQNITFWNQLSPESSGYFRVPYSGQYFFNARFGYEQFYPGTVPTYFRFRVMVADSPSDFPNNATILWQNPGIGFPAIQSTQYANLFFSGQCSAGQYIKPYIFLDQGALANGVYLSPYQALTIQDEAPMWELYASPFLSTSSAIDMQFQMPDYTAQFFMKGLINLFNLVVVETEQDKEFRIEPLPWYLAEENRVTRDFNEALDISKPVKIEPLTFDLPKEVKWFGKYDENETYNRLYFSQNQLIFGEQRYLTNYTIPTGIKEITVPFAPVPTNFISGSTNVVIPQLFKEGDNATELPYSNNPHLFFYVGNRYFYKDWGDTQVGNQRYWWLLSGGTPVAQTTYPHVSHLSTLEETDGSLFSDLNFFPSTDFYFSATTNFSKYTQNTTYGYWWKTYIENLYSTESRKLTGDFIMSPEIYSQLKLNDKIFIKDASYRIDKIENANLVEPDSTKIVLVKDVLPYYKVIPNAPFISISPNSPYPPPLSPTVYPFTAVSNYDSFLVCDRDTPLVAYWSSNPLGLVDGATIYTNSGATILADTGLYLRIVSDSENFVIDTFGDAQSNGFC
jgi:hypothetical protein